MNSRSYLGRSFEVWNREQSWFWMVADSSGERGAIGAAASEWAAVCDACTSIEETSPARPATRSIHLSARTWEVSLSNLERHLSTCSYA